MRYTLRIPQETISSFSQWLMRILLPSGLERPTIGDVQGGRHFRYDISGSNEIFEAVNGWSRDDSRLISVKLKERPSEDIDVVVECLDQSPSTAVDQWSGLVNLILQRWPKAYVVEGLPKRRGPRPRTEEIAHRARELKRGHPGWSYEKVAMKLRLPVKEGDLGDESIYGETVRNAYRSMAQFYGPEECEWEGANRKRE